MEAKRARRKIEREEDVLRDSKKVCALVNKREREKETKNG